MIDHAVRHYVVTIISYEYLKILLIGGLDNFVKCCSSIGELEGVVKNAVLLMVQRTELPPPPH